MRTLLVEQGGVDVPEDGNCYILHHRAIVIDARTMITGSYNFTGSAEQDNDENLVIVDDPNLAHAYRDEPARMYAQAQARCRYGEAASPPPKFPCVGHVQRQSRRT